MLRLTKSTVAALIREAAGQPDREVCGLVWGSEGLRAQTVHPLANVHPNPSKYYRTEPADIGAAFTRMDAEGGEPLAWYHSHPGGKSDPSEEDMAGALDKGMHYLILYPEKRPAPAGYITQWMFSAWECLEPGVLVQAEYRVEP